MKGTMSSQIPRNIMIVLTMALCVSFGTCFSLGNGKARNTHVHETEQTSVSRKDFIGTGIASMIPLVFPNRAFAEDVDPKIFTRTKSNPQFGYTITLPFEVVTTNKPLQTHLDEVNLPSEKKGFTYGITVDPIRIASLRDFGTPNEVAAKIVMAELRRDGVLDVTMGQDPVEDSSTGAYDIEYISDGKRGKKHFVTRTVVKGGKLYVLTVQCKEDDWNSVEKDVWASVQTFKVLD